MVSDLHKWVKSFPAAITVCDSDGIIIEMNERSVETFKEEGGEKLIGLNLLDCHPEPARSKLKELLSHKQTNVYTIEKNGIKKIIYQSPWYEDDKFAGLVEISFPLPNELPNFVRK